MRNLPTFFRLIRKFCFGATALNTQERHRKDFSSEEEYEFCFERIPWIIRHPDYISIHPNKDSISFICKFTDNVSVAVRLSADGRLAYRTMYPLRDSQLNNYISQGRAWKV
ncbi:PBECR2 nuclease fold domain-containing protein [Massilistercora timonensis]|uniref:PBECR3 domain-containing polyvalent protein n=1 Tax=Massilistercora timonensis TaxID=2086584 RepID=UPI003AB1F365